MDREAKTMVLAAILMANLLGTSPNNHREKKAHKSESCFVSQAAALVGLPRHAVTALSAGIFCVGPHHYS